MKKSNNKKGFVLVLVVMIVLVLSIVIPSFYYLAFSHYNVAILDGSRQQAYYNANSGIEYARVILEHSAYNLLDSSTWPNRASFPCFVNDANRGTVQVFIRPNTTGIGGYDITSTGSVGNITAVRNAHCTGRTGGGIDS